MGKIISEVAEVLRRRGRHWQVVHEPLEFFLEDGGDYQWLIDDPESFTSGGGNAFSWRSVGHGIVHIFFDIGPGKPNLVARIKASVLLEVVELLARARRVRERREQARREWELHHEEWERKWADDARRRRRKAPPKKGR